eukprot:3312050-Amphidinium_carterae.1
MHHGTTTSRPQGVLQYGGVLSTASACHHPVPTPTCNTHTHRAPANNTEQPDARGAQQPMTCGAQTQQPAQTATPTRQHHQ